MNVSVTHLNPPEMHSNPAFSQAVVVEGNARTIYVGGQNAVSPDGQVVGIGDLAAQTELVFANLGTVLASAGADLHDVVRWTLYVVEGQDLRPGLAVFQKVWGDAPPPAISMIQVAGLANPDFLLEMDAVAVVPAGGSDRARGPAAGGA
jgi:enamine deaminase RidA (YjgF/YER057c/UK114 family)